MKKILSLILVFALAMSIISCGSGDSELEKPSSVEIVDDSTSKSENASKDDAAEQSKDVEQPVEKAATIEETVLVDESGVKIIAKSLNMGALFGTEIKLLIENNSGKDLTVQTRDVSVNGYMVETMLSADVANGKKANDDITLMSSDLEACGITNIADIELSFYIRTTDDFKKYLETDPIKLKTSIADTYKYTFDDSGDIAYNENGIKIVIKGLDNSSILGPSLVVYIENNTDSAFVVQNENVSINGFMIDSIFSCDVLPEKKAVDSITFLNSALEENDITSIENVELSFHVFDPNNFDTIVDTEAIKITF